jgi:hypothetical protein
MAGPPVLARILGQVSTTLENLEDCERKLTISLQSQHLKRECFRNVERSRAPETPIQHRPCDFLCTSKSLNPILDVSAMH